MSEKLEHILKIYPAYDKRNSNPNKNYGIHGVTMCFYVKGSKGAVQFMLYTNWHLPNVMDEFKHSSSEKLFLFLKPLPVDLGYHSKKPHYKGQESSKCNFLKCGKCYYDGSALNAQKPFDILVSKGSDKLWKYLEDYYRDVFHV